MTWWQEIMLSVCFGSSVGLMVGSLVSFIMIKIDEHKEKKQCKNEEMNNKD